MKSDYKACKDWTCARPAGHSGDHMDTDAWQRHRYPEPSLQSCDQFASDHGYGPGHCVRCNRPRSEHRESEFRDPPKRITVNDGNPAGPLVYDLGSVNVALTRERDELRAEVERLKAALHWIASVNPDRRPDGTYNIDRVVLIERAQEALK